MRVRFLSLAMLVSGIAFGQYFPPSGGGGGSTPGGTEGAAQFNISSALGGDAAIAKGVLTAASAPSAPTVTSTCTGTCTTAWKYGVVVFTEAGSTPHSALTTGSGGTNNPDSTHHWNITLPTVSGAASCGVYRDTNGTDPNSWGSGVLIDSTTGMPVTHACDGSVFQDTGYEGWNIFWNNTQTFPDTNSTVGVFESRVGGNQFGTGATADASSFAAGQYSSAVNDSVVIGPFATSTGNGYNVAIGAAALAGSTEGATIAIGSGAQAKAASCIALGYYTQCSGLSAYSLGEGANASADRAISIGNDSVASAQGAVSVGWQASASAANSCAFGAGASATSANTCVIGAGTVTDVYFGSTTPAATIHPAAIASATTATTQSANDNSTKLATTAYVDTGLALKANLASPTFTGTPSLPTGTTGVTQSANNNSTKLATTAYVDAKPAPGVVLLAEQTASSSSALNFTTRNAAGQSGAIFQSDYDDYEVRFSGVVAGTNGQDCALQISTDGGATYESSAYGWVGFGWVSSGSGLASGNSYIQLAFSVSSSAANSVMGWIRIADPLSTSSDKLFHGMGGGYDATNSTDSMRVFHGRWHSTTAVNAFRVLMQSGNMATGVFRVYGYAK